MAERAGVSFGSLYQYFSGKDAVFECLLERQADRASSACWSSTKRIRSAHYARRCAIFEKSRSSGFCLGAGAAITIGVLRIVADRHWGSDVLMGLAVGATVGYYDILGPFDLLRFDVQSHDLARNVQGIALPYVTTDEYGIKVALMF
ncbi:MAG: phosphatase PAP2 family protein [Myxococcota bacterium]